MSRPSLFARAPRRTLPPRSNRPSFHLGLVAAIVLLIAGFVTSGTGTAPPEALAAVVHQTGFEATVAGWTSWYGNYGLGDLGWGWCIDHGIPAPDAAYGYVPISIDNETDGDAQAAMAWAATMYEPTSDVEAAAIMLVQHDLRRAVYPFGTLDVDALSVSNLAGFGGAEGAVLDRARTIKADALAHAHFRAPFTLTIKLVPADPGVETVGWAALSDANGTPVPGAPVQVQSSGPTLTSPASGVTLPDGAMSFTFVTVPGSNQFLASATMADPQPRLFGPTTVRAQRIIQPRALRVDAEARFEWVPPTTVPPTTQPPTTQPPTTAPPTTVPATTTTIRPATTTTRRPTTTTTRPPTSTTTSTPTSTTSTSSTTTTASTTTSTSTSTSTSIPSTSTTSTAPPDTTTTTTSHRAAPPEAPVPPPGTTRGSLPTTGTPARSLSMIGAGLVLLGVSAVSAARRRTPPDTTVAAH